MASSSTDDIPTQLAALLGKKVLQIRKTNETPPRISVIDVVQAITEQNQSNSALAFKRLQHDHPEVTANSSDFKFKGQGAAGLQNHGRGAFKSRPRGFKTKAAEYQ